MAVKSKSGRTKAKAAKGKAPRPAARAARPAPKPAVEKLECRVCGFRVIVDATCGCAEEHVIICCDEPMIRTKSGR